MSILIGQGRSYHIRKTAFAYSLILFCPFSYEGFLEVRIQKVCGKLLPNSNFGGIIVLRSKTPFEGLAHINDVEEVLPDS